MIVVALVLLFELRDRPSARTVTAPSWQRSSESAGEWASRGADDSVGVPLRLGLRAAPVVQGDRYLSDVVTSVLGAPGSGKTAVATVLRGLLPTHVILDWDAFMPAAAELAGRAISTSPSTWPAYLRLARLQ